MKKTIATILLGLILFATTITTAQPANIQTVAFVGGSVIPMDKERVLKNQTVLIRGGRIAESGDAGKIKIPAGATQSDGRGKFLMPGIVDMHLQSVAGRRHQ
jgi:imidazolonepropionase-like amidohydrolase